MLLDLDNISIRYKLIFIQTLASVIVVGLFFALFTIADVNSYKNRKVKAVLGLAQVIGTNNIASLRFQDNEAAAQDLEAFRKVAPEILHARILDVNGKTFAKYDKTGFDTPPSYPPGMGNYLFDNDYLWIGTDITEGKEKLGRVEMQLELSELHQLIRSKYNLAFLLLTAAVGFSLLLAIALQKYISRRLLRLANTMKEVSRTGNYDLAVSNTGNDEISTLILVFNNLMQQVKENQRRKDEFIGIASHELKTPLTSIKGYVQLLLNMEDRQPQQQFAQKAHDNVAKLERLINDLLDVSKIQSGQLQLNIQEFPVDKFIDDTIDNFQLISQTHRIVKISPPLELQIAGDQQRLEQVFYNILSNAVKYSPDGKRVLVSASKEDGTVVIKVRDFGVGIPRDEQQNIFERFYRTRGTSRTISGFGLGLYISQDIIKRHNGRIWVQSEESGSSFYISLPIRNNSYQTDSLAKPINLSHEKNISNR